MRCSQGQGTVEYLAVVLLAAVVLGGGTGAIARATGADVATAVPHQVLYAICVVTRGDCDRDRAPCDVAARTATREWSVTVLVLKGGRRRILVRERRSDGTVLLTDTSATLGGLELTAGAGARIRLGGRTLDLGGQTTAAAIATLGRGRAWLVANDGAADRLVAALRAGDPLPPPDQRFTQGDLGLEGRIGVAPGGGRVTAGATIGVFGAAGRRTDVATGAQTYFFEGGVGGYLTVSLPALGASAVGAGADREQYALTIDRTGRWLDLGVVRTGEVAGSVTLPDRLRPVADALNAPTAGGRRWVAETHLDLSDPASLAAARAFVDGLTRGPRAAAAATAGLSARLEERGIVDVRTYALDRSASGFDVHAGEGLGIGAAGRRTTEQTRLVAAATRGLGGQWRRRDDCLKEA